MRRGHIDKAKTYQDLLTDPLFAQAFRWLKDNPHPTPRAEPYSIVDDNVRAIVIEYIPEPLEAGRLETHHEHVDLQVCLGADPERIIIAPAFTLTVAEDVPEKDVTFYVTPPADDLNLDSEVLDAGEFIIFDTERDAHMPQRIFDDLIGPSPNRKVVIKLRKSNLDSELYL